MKILHISKYYFPYVGGTEQVARDICSSFNDDSIIEQKVICFNDSNKSVIDDVGGIQIIRCACFAKLFSQPLSYVYYKKLKNVLDTFKPDLIIFHYPNPLISSILLKLLNKKIKLVLYWHLDITKQKYIGKLFHRQNIELLERANKIVATSPNYIDGSNYLNKYKEKCVVIPNCVSINYDNISKELKERAQEIKDKYKNKFICFTVGRHIPYKGFEYLIEASNYLDNDCVVLIGGKGPLTNKLKEKAKNSKNVELIGFVSGEDLIAYYLACDVITFSSITKNEAFGISLAEGMAFGKPAITFTIPGSGVNYVNLNGITGIECSNKNYKEYADAINLLKTNSELKQKYGVNAKERVKALFTFEKFKENINNLIETIRLLG